SEVYATLNATIARTGILMVAGLLISALTALWLARGLVRPIRTLQEGAQRIGEGELEQKIDIRTGDELEALADQFNRMTGQLRESYAGLEKKVEDRTREINEALRQQTATAEVLKAISRSTLELDSVLQILIDNATKLCNAVNGVILRPNAEGGFVPTVAHGYAPDSAVVAEMHRNPLTPGPGSGTGRA